MLALQLILLFYRHSKWETSEHISTRSSEHLPLALLCGFLIGESAPDSKARSPAVETAWEGLLIGTKGEGSRVPIGSESGQSGKNVKGGGMNGTGEGEVTGTVEGKERDCYVGSGEINKAKARCIGTENRLCVQERDLVRIRQAGFGHRWTCIRTLTWESAPWGVASFLLGACEDAEAAI